MGIPFCPVPTTPLATMKSFWCLTLSPSYNTVGPYICIYTTRLQVHIHLYMNAKLCAGAVLIFIYMYMKANVFYFSNFIFNFLYIYIKNVVLLADYSAIMLERFIRNFSCKGIFCRILLTILTTSEILNEIFWTLIFSFAKLNFVSFKFFGFSLLQNSIFWKF